MPNLHISRIEPHPENARQVLAGIDELAASIKAAGLLHPLVVCAHPWRPAGYMLLDGHRRYAACKKLRLDQIAVTIRVVPDDAQAIMLVADLHHSPLSAVERAEAMGKLLANGWSPARIAAETGLHISTISRILALNDLDQGTRNRVAAGVIPVGTAVAAVRQVRAGNRAAEGRPPRKVSVAADHFSVTHPLAEDARVRCELAGHGGRKVGRSAGFPGACGACWEDVIRDDALAGRPPKPRLPQSATARDRVAELSSMRLHQGDDPVPPPGAVTAAQAAERLGVTPRTIERYKAHLRPVSAHG